MPLQEPSEVDALQRKVVDALHRIVSGVGVAVVVVGMVRARYIGDMWPFLIPAVAVAIILLAFVFRGRLSWFVRSWFILIGLAITGAMALWHYGVAAPGGVLVPTSVVIACLIWGRWQATAFTALCAVALLSGALKNIHLGCEMEGRMGEYNRAPLFWLNLGLIYLSVGAAILGVVRVLFGSFREAVSRARQGERQSRADKERLAGILRGIHDAIFIHDADTGEILELHGPIEEIFGFDRRDILDLGIALVSEGSAPWNAAELPRWIERCRREGPRTFPWYARRADGSTFWVQVDMRMVRLLDRELVLVTVRDVDKSVRTQRELVELNSELEQRVLDRTAEIERSRREMETFSYSVSHDLRAPLRAIDGFARILKEDHGDKLPPDGIQAIERIVAGAGRMARLTDALLGLSRLDHRPMNPRSVDVAAIVREIRDELDDAGCRIGQGGSGEVHWVFDDLPAVVADPELLRQVFANLMGNACKFTRDKAHPRIWVGTEERLDGIWFVVSDNGCGFDMAYADKLFKVFQRLHDGSTEGLGIGLATVRKAVDRMGGAVEANGKVGEGATFRFRPARPMTESVKNRVLSDPDR